VRRLAAGDLGRSGGEVEAVDRRCLPDVVGDLALFEVVDQVVELLRRVRVADLAEQVLVGGGGVVLQAVDAVEDRGVVG
jgi:hypothetical protein